MNSRHSFSGYIKVNRVINLFVLLYYFEVISAKNLPGDWPCDWSNGTIPFAYNFFSQSPRRLIGLVKNGLEHLEMISCLKFQEHDPVVLAHTPNLTYLYYTYSGVLENCCLDLYTRPVGRRVVLITPMCTVAMEVAHVTLHGIGLWHQRGQPFSFYKTRSMLFPTLCDSSKDKLKSFDLGRQGNIKWKLKAGQKN